MVGERERGVTKLELYGCLAGKVLLVCECCIVRRGV